MVPFAALIRCRAEYFRLKWLLGPAFTLARIQPFIFGRIGRGDRRALVAVIFYFADKDALTVLTAVVTVVALLALRFALL